MILIRERIQSHTEKLVTDTQFGFRPAKSTAHAIFIVRILQGFSEKAGYPLYLTLLDWEKAFDKIDHNCLCEALSRFGIDDETIEVLRVGYKKATFFTEEEFGKSEKNRQSSGIRQGCPLSPYIFVLVLTCISEYIKSEIS